MNRINRRDRSSIWHQQLHDYPQHRLEPRLAMWWVSHMWEHVAMARHKGRPRTSLQDSKSSLHVWDPESLEVSCPHEAPSHSYWLEIVCSQSLLPYIFASGSVDLPQWQNLQLASATASVGLGHAWPGASATAMPSSLFALPCGRQAAGLQLLPRPRQKKVCKINLAVHCKKSESKSQAL